MEDADESTELCRPLRSSNIYVTVFGTKNILLEFASKDLRTSFKYKTCYG